MMTFLTSVALIVYCTAAFGIHGGEGITGIPRQIRNLICAIPFAAVAHYAASHATNLYPALAAILSFTAAYIGVNMGFNSADTPGGQPTSLWLAFKGFITFSPLGAILLPVAYWIGYKTRYTNVLAEYLSGALYGVSLAAIVAVW